LAGVTLDSVSKIYDDRVTAVRSATIAIEEGEFMVLVGPSGCGKSTTLRMVAGLEEVSSGTIRIGSRDVTHLAPKDRDVAMVFQNYALYPHMSCFDNMAFALKIRGLPKTEIARKVDEAAHILGIETLLERKPRQLSGGQRQRVAVGRAIVRDPKVFLFDEPLSNLDAKLRVQMRAEISRLHSTLSATMIYVTHDQVEAMTMGDRIVVMLDGEIQQIATPMELYHQPVNRFVAGFIGSPPMNFLDGRIEQREGLRLSAGGIDLPLDGLEELLRNHLERRVEVGFRPQGLRPAKPGEGFDARVEVVEPMGSETFVHLRIGETPISARLAADVELGHGDRICLRPDPHALHLFDGETGLAIA